jgi:hypothetical protein
MGSACPGFSARAGFFATAVGFARGAAGRVVAADLSDVVVCDGADVGDELEDVTGAGVGAGAGAGAGVDDVVAPAPDGWGSGAGASLVVGAFALG